MNLPQRITALGLWTKLSRAFGRFFATKRAPKILSVKTQEGDSSAQREPSPAHQAVKQLQDGFVWNANRGAWTPRHRTEQTPSQQADESVA